MPNILYSLTDTCLKYLADNVDIKEDILPQELKEHLAQRRKNDKYLVKEPDWFMTVAEFRTTVQELLFFGFDHLESTTKGSNFLNFCIHNKYLLEKCRSEFIVSVTVNLSLMLSIDKFADLRPMWLLLCGTEFDKEFFSVVWNKFDDEEKSKIKGAVFKPTCAQCGSAKININYLRPELWENDPITVLFSCKDCGHECIE